MTVKHQYSTVSNSLSNNLNDMWISPQTNHAAETSSTPGDLVSLAWLQKGDIIQMAPLDGEEEHTSNSFVSSTASFNPSVSDDGNLDLPPANEELQIFPLTKLPPPKPIFGSNVADVPPRPSSTNSETYSSHCQVDQSRFPTYPPLSGQGLTKPNYSYTHLIFMAIESSPQKCMTVNQIYNWCELNFPFYKHAGGGWKNSLRHNLSINKSFKRLPRDSRGPGRGAFWTVEPRERANLLDAIKRNPWNFNNLASLVSSTQRGAGALLFNTPYFLANNMHKFSLTSSAPGNLLRGGLNERLHDDDLLQYPSSEYSTNSVESLLNLPPGSVQLMSTADGRLIATCGGGIGVNHRITTDVTSNGHGDNPSMILTSDCEDIFTPNKTVLPDSRYWLSPDRSKVGNVTAAAEMEWSTEDEEKYLKTISSLSPYETLDSPINKQLQLDAAIAAADGSNIDEPKHVTKQRRKSRLLPTRTADDNSSFNLTHPLGHIIGKCNECKENAASGCESCHSRHFSVPPSETESLIAEIINTLDSDQEHGPAGGPLNKRSTVKSVLSHTAKPPSIGNADDQNQTLCIADSDIQPKDTNDEVYVTPAPYLDHEYAHCQAQLRLPEENQVINRYNELYCSEALNQLVKTRPFLNHSPVGVGRLRGRNIEVHSVDETMEDEEEEEEEEYDNDNEDSMSEVNDAGDEFVGAKAHEKGSYSELGDEEDDREDKFGVHDVVYSGNMQNHSQYGRSKLGMVHNQRRRRGRAAATVSRIAHPFDERILSVPKRGRRGRRWNHHKIGIRKNTDAGGKHFVTRRSKRVVRAPRRLYDDFEESLSIEPYNRSDELSVEEVDSDKYMESNLNAGQTRNLKYKYFTRNDLLTPGRRGRQRGRCRGVYRRRSENCHNHLIEREHLQGYLDMADVSDTSFEADEEAEYLRLAAARQRQMGALSSSTILDDNHSSLNSESRFRDYDTENRPTEKRRGRPRTVGIGAMWSQSRLAIARKLVSPDRWRIKGASACELMTERRKQVAGKDSTAYLTQETGSTDCHRSNERATVEAAQLLFGISQIQNFRRQSGYLDSSGASSYDSVDATRTATHQTTATLGEPADCLGPRSPVTSSSPMILANM